LASGGRGARVILTDGEAETQRGNANARQKNGGRMKIIAEWIERRTISASEMPATTLVNSYRDSLKFEENPLSDIYEAEILRRLWLIPTLKK
jgi:hypothetical protein